MINIDRITINDTLEVGDNHFGTIEQCKMHGDALGSKLELAFELTQVEIWFQPVKSYDYYVSYP